MRQIKLMVALLGALVCSASTCPARAEQSEQSQRSVARELGTAGMEAYFDGDYARAADNLDRAYRLFPTPTLGLWSGRAYLQLGQWVRAAERFREVQYASAAVGDNAAQQKAQADAASELASLEPRIPRLTVTIAGARAADVNLTVDRLPFERELIGIAHPIDPGSHSVVGTFQAQRVEVAVELTPAASEVAHLEFTPATPVVPGPALASPLPPQPQPQPALVPVPAPGSNREAPGLRIAAIVSGSAGGAALAASLVTTLLARNKLGACEQRSGEYWCNDKQADAYDTYRSVATVTFYAGAALAGAGIALWFLQPSSDSQKSVTVSATPLSAELSLKF